MSHSSLPAIRCHTIHLLSITTTIHLQTTTKPTIIVRSQVAAGGKDIGFKIIGAHTDSPNLRLKPKSKRKANGLIQLNVECYGGGVRTK